MQPRDTVAYLSDWKAKIDQGGGGGDNGDMEARVTKLEAAVEKTHEKLADLQRELVRLDGSIRADMHKEFTAQTWRIIGAMLTFGTMLSAAVFFIAKNVH